MRALALAALLAAGSALAQTANERLYQSIKDGKEPVAAILVLGGKVDVSHRYASRETALHLAAEKGMAALTRLLLDAGAATHARTATGETPLHHAALNEDPAVALLLLDAGADPNALNDHGESALHWAAYGGNVAVVRLLLERGADANAVNLDGNLALHGAADAGREDTVKLLLPRTREPAHRNGRGKSPRDLASERGFDAVAALLP